MDEAMLVGWLVSPGDQVSRGDIIAEVETDKGVMEVECWDEGIIDELLIEPSSTKLPVGTPLARIRAADKAPAAEPEPARVPVAVGVAAPPDTPSPAPPPHVTLPVSPPVRHLAHQLGVDVDSITPTGPEGTVTREDVRRAAGRRRVSPRARRLAMEEGIDLSLVSPTGPDGMIVVADLSGVDVKAVVSDETPAPTEEPIAQPDQAVPAAEPEPGADDPALAMRRAIARTMARSNTEIPQ